MADETLRYLLGDDGPFAAAKEGFKARSEQLEMALGVNAAINYSDNNRSPNLLVEAGTGVGKTFAYLVPALMSGKQVVISTGTKNLQDQLFKRDLPAILKTLQRSPLTALLKGRNNYLCEYRLESTLATGRLPDPDAVKHLSLVNRWREKTRSGDLGELSPLPEDSPVIPYVTSSVDNCLGQDCPFIDKCFLAAARERARKAKVLVINHHLLLADLVLKADGFGELLPDTDVFIIDEAHHLIKTAYQFYGDCLSSRQLVDLCRELELEYRTQITDCRDLMLTAQSLAKAVKDFRVSMPEFDTRGEWNVKHPMATSLRLLFTKIEQLLEVVKVNATRTKVLESCFERLAGLKQVASAFLEEKNSPTASAQLSGATDPLQSPDLSMVNRVNWFETMKSGFRLNTTPLDVAALFQQSRKSYASSSWIMTSATLSVNASFDHFIQSLGWNDIRTMRLGSSFDYYNQSMLYVPRYLPSPKNATHTRAVIEATLPLIQEAQGRTFILFTSHRALRSGAEVLKGLGLFECLVQGETSKAALLKRFEKTDNAVLLGTGSFWEGVDVVGQNLVLVVIDKLPFAPPDDPLLNAKIKQCKQKKGNPFFELQIPEAVLTLKQGCGRLIRSIDDRGVVCLCDSRVTGKQYGEIFVNSLPDMRRTREQERVLSFIKNIIATA